MLQNRVHGNTGIDHIARYLRDFLSNDTILTEFYFGNSDEELLNKIPTDCEIYGFSVFETNYILARRTAAQIKLKNPHAVIVFGGQFVTINFHEIVVDAVETDYLILGDGESPMFRLANFLRNNTEKMLGDRNIVSINDVNGKIANVELDVNRATSFDYYKNDSVENNRKKTHAIMTKSNTCQGACTFCCSRKGRVIYRSSENLLSEITYLADKFSVKDFWLTDDDIFDVESTQNRSRLKLFLEGLQAQHFNLGFSAFAKPRSICNPENLTLLKKMSQTGFHHIFLGLDAGNMDDLKLYNKRSTLEQGIKAVNILREVGIGVRFGMIFLNPYSTLKKMRDSYEYLLKLHSTNYFHYGGWRVQLLQGTKLLEKVRQDGLLNSDFSFLNNQSFQFAYTETKPIVEILDDLMPRLDAIRNQFNILRYKFYTAIHLDECAKNYENLLKTYADEEFYELQKFFYFLYVMNDYKYCRTHSKSFVSKMQERANRYEPIIKELKKIIFQAKIRK